ncbi:hypothetical protein M406DRAFT_75857 [Cryphonectria parasitica EP155]|uniref:DUF6923 domain-containing protein n=1 Tax=Cryphonectria parasitica (strain ATCC 38755 / EP155) TaxID=660469 RepID=A0A9P4Y9P1_CRYP1|nr:uncharacterized protein M406DRAFT_75857 [Cryphonectria parasitica EP155]KAF3769378.1 hypothetical protein M406DRAFT_75857 [Cryphonectria parasitica EP155]
MVVERPAITQLGEPTEVGSGAGPAITASQVAFNAASAPMIMNQAPLPPAATIAIVSMIVLSMYRPSVPTLIPRVALADDNSYHRKRQAALSNFGMGYVSASGTMDECSNAKVYQLMGYNLTDLDTNQPVLVNPDVPYINLSNLTIGTITTRFEVVNSMLCQNIVSDTSQSLIATRGPSAISSISSSAIKDSSLSSLSSNAITGTFSQPQIVSVASPSSSESPLSLLSPNQFESPSESSIPTTSSSSTSPSSTPTIYVYEGQSLAVSLEAYLRDPTDSVASILSPENWIYDSETGGIWTLHVDPPADEVPETFSIAVNINGSGEIYSVSLLIVVLVSRDPRIGPTLSLSTVLSTQLSALSTSLPTPIVFYAYPGQELVASLIPYLRKPTDTLSRVHSDPFEAWIYGEGRNLIADVSIDAAPQSFAVTVSILPSDACYSSLAQYHDFAQPSTTAFLKLFRYKFSIFFCICGCKNNSANNTADQNITYSILVESPFPTWSCDAYAYLVQSTTLLQVNLTTGSYNTVSTSLGNGNDNLNAVSYNPTDNYIYGVTSNGSSSRFVRISALGTSVLSVPLNLTGTASLRGGDFDQYGVYWGFTQWNAVTTFYKIDLNPQSRTYLQTLNSSTATVPGTWQLYDWAFSATPGNDAYLYGLGVNPTGYTNTLLRFTKDLVGGATSNNWTAVAAEGHTANSTNNSYGAMFSVPDGSLYGWENTVGQIWKFPIPGTASASINPNATYVSQGPGPGTNIDGGHCPYTFLNGTVYSFAGYPT